MLEVVRDGGGCGEGGGKVEREVKRGRAAAMISLLLEVWSIIASEWRMLVLEVVRERGGEGGGEGGGRWRGGGESSCHDQSTLGGLIYNRLRVEDVGAIEIVY